MTLEEEEDEEEAAEVEEVEAEVDDEVEAEEDVEIGVSCTDKPAADGFVVVFDADVDAAVDDVAAADAALLFPRLHAEKNEVELGVGVWDGVGVSGVGVDAA